MKPNIAAIDPGRNGAIVWTYNGMVCAEPMPSVPADVLRLLNNLKIKGIETIYIEKINGFISKAGAGQQFKFGKGYGYILGACAAFSFNVSLVTPQAWMKSLAVGKRSQWDEQWKSHLKEVAQRLYPEIQVTLKTADALLILEYARRQYAD